MVAERKIAAEEGKTKHDYADASSTRSGNGKNESGGTITKQLRRLGASVDWDRESVSLWMMAYLTLRSSEVFVRLYEDDLIIVVSV